MAYDEDLAGRARGLLAELTDFDERKMFGGLAFMVNTHMACGIVGDDLVVDMPNPVMGAEDWSYVLQQVPGAMAFLGTCPPGQSFHSVAPNHSNRMVIDEDAMAVGVALYAATALDELAAR